MVVKRIYRVRRVWWLAVYSICKSMSVCPVMNGSAVEGPERLDRDRRDHGSRYGTCANACVCWHQSFKNSGSNLHVSVGASDGACLGWVFLATEILADHVPI
jgi:hypothetical protein